MGAVRSAFSVRGAPSGLTATPSAAPAPPLSSGATAAVLITLVPTDRSGDASPAAVVLIRRAAHLRRNPGEIGFPGGAIEPGEEPLAAALREAEEEVGLPPGAVEILGRLSAPVRTRLSHLIVAFVGAASELPVLEANAEEVEAIARRTPGGACRPRPLLAGALGRRREPDLHDALLRPRRGRDLGRDGRDAPHAVAPLAARTRRTHRRCEAPRPPLASAGCAVGSVSERTDREARRG